MGLLLPHKSTISIYPDMVTVRPTNPNPKGGGGKRKQIEGFSEESRYRLFRMLHELTFERVTFITLTYPAEFPTEPRVYKAHLKEYRRRFERLYGPVRAVWRLEFQKRGAPHYHLMYLDAPFIPAADLSELWSNVTGSNDPNHRKIGVDVKLVTSRNEGALVASYLAKYVGKPTLEGANNGNNKVGRWWGRWNIEESHPVEIEVGSGTASNLVAQLLGPDAGGGKWRPVDISACTVFGDSMGCDKYREHVLAVLEQVKRRGFTRKS